MGVRSSQDWGAFLHPLPDNGDIATVEAEARLVLPILRLPTKTSLTWGPRDADELAIAKALAEPRSGRRGARRGHGAEHV